MRIHEARQILAEYQALMDLNAWAIHLRWGKGLECEGVDGRCVWVTEYGTADILLSRKQADREIPRTIIHELCHLALQGHTGNEGGYDPLFEQGINKLTGAIWHR